MRHLHHASTPDELAFLVDEVWGGELGDAAAYGYGLAALEPGDVFCDVGANVGLASLFAAERVRARAPGDPQGTVLALEPGPRAHAALRANVALYLAALAEEEVGGGEGGTTSVAAASATSAAGVELSLVPLAAVALGSEAARRGTIELNTWPRAAGWATTVAQAAESSSDAGIEADMVAFLRRHSAAVAEDRAAAPAFGSRLLARAGSALARRSPGAFDSAARLYVRRVLLSGRERVAVAAAPLGRVLGERLGAERELALLKVDVEGSEAEVLKGLEAKDWRRIRRVVVEASSGKGGGGISGGGTIAEVSRLLRDEGGFRFVEVGAQAPALEGTSLFLVRAER